MIICSARSMLISPDINVALLLPLKEKKDMNSKEFNLIQQRDDYDPTQHIVTIDPRYVEFEKSEDGDSNVRVGDTAVRKLPALMTDIKNRGQQVPISLVPHPTKPGHYIAKDGTTRWHACKGLEIQVLGSIYHAMVTLKDKPPSAPEWYFLQCEWNANHEVSTPSTQADIRQQIGMMVDRGYLNPVCGQPFVSSLSKEEKEKWVEKAMGKLQGTYLSVEKAKLEKILWDRLAASTPNPDFKNYTKSEEMEFFNKYNPFVKDGTTITKIGAPYSADNGENHAYYRAGSTSHLSKEILSYAYRAKMNNPSLKITVAVQHADIVRSDSDGISAEIDKLVKTAKKLNDAGGFFFDGAPTKVIDYLVVLPQHKRSDDMDKAKKVVDFSKL